MVQISKETSCKLMNLSGMYQLYTEEVSTSKMKPVQIEDLIGSNHIRSNMEEVYEYITKKVALVTGTIGSELSR